MNVMPSLVVALRYATRSSVNDRALTSTAAAAATTEQSTLALPLCRELSCSSSWTAPRTIAAEKNGSKEMKNRPHGVTTAAETVAV